MDSVWVVGYEPDMDEMPTLQWIFDTEPAAETFVSDCLSGLDFQVWEWPVWADGERPSYPWVCTGYLYVSREWGSGWVLDRHMSEVIRPAHFMLTGEPIGLKVWPSKRGTEGDVTRAMVTVRAVAANKEDAGRDCSAELDRIKADLGGFMRVEWEQKMERR